MNDDLWTRVHESCLIDRPEYRWDIAEWRHGDASMVFVHLQVREWSKTTLKRMREEWRVFRDLVDYPIFAMSPNSDEKWQQFVALFGFKHLCDVDKRRKIFISTKDNNNGRQRLH